MSIKNSQIFNINSRNRISGSDSDFSIVLNVDKNVEYSKVLVSGGAIPKSYYLVQSGYNTFTLQEGASTATITLTPGNYNRRSLANVLKTLLDAGSVSMGHSYVYTITYNNAVSEQDSGLFYYSVSGNSGTQPKFIFTTYLYEVLGFAKNSTNTFSASALTSSNVIKLTSEDTLYLHSNIINNPVDDVLAVIYTSSEPYFSVVSFDFDTTHARNFKQSKDQVFNFKLTNEDGVILNTNGLNITFTLIVYNEYNNDIANLLRDSNKMKALKQILNTNQ